MLKNEGQRNEEQKYQEERADLAREIVKRTAILIVLGGTAIIIGAILIISALV